MQTNAFGVHWMNSRMQHDHGHHHEHEHHHGQDCHHHQAATASWIGLSAKVADEAMGACPWLLLGLVVTVLMQEVRLPNNAVRRVLTLHSVQPTVWDLFRLCVVAACVGLVTPLCSCGAVPLAIALAQQGATPAAVVAFLTAAQSAGVDSAAITVGMLGWQTAGLRLLGAIALSVGAGMAIGRTARSATKLKDTGSVSSRAMIGRTWYERIVAAWRVMDSIWVVLFAGIVVSVLVQEYFGASELYSVGGESDLMSRLGVIVGSLPFQLCEHGVVSFAATLEKSGASQGTAHAFLLTAPATNLATMGAVLTSVGGVDRLASVRSIVAISGIALILSYTIDVFFSGSMPLGNAVETFGLPDWWCSLSVWVCGALVAASIIRNLPLPPG